MSETVWLLRDPERPGIYLIARRIRQPDPLLAALGKMPLRDTEMIPWRVARKIMEPEGFYELCGMAFSDWISKNPPPYGPDDE